MTIILEPFTLPKKGKVKLKVDRSFDIKVTAEEARQKVQRWLVDEVSLLPALMNLLSSSVTRSSGVYRPG